VNDRSDQQLLQDYAHHRSETAFAELVRRHIDLVYSAALRRLGDAHLAEDIAQGTFTALAQNAPVLAGHPVLSGWLHRTTQNLAANLIRTNLRRQTREQEAVTMNQLLSSAPDDVNWQSIAPHLDAALDELESPDRDVVMLRYFEKKSAREAAVQLGLSEAAAQKRVSRAVDRLREFFAKRGVTVGASGLAVVISAHAVQAAPVGLALTISTAAALTGTTLATTATVTATKAIAMTALQKTVVAATIAVLAGVGIYEARQASRLREQVQTLQRQQAPLTEEVQRLKIELNETASQLAQVHKSNEQLNQNTADLLRLRAKVAQLRAATNSLASLSTTNNPMVAEVEFWLSRVEMIKQRLNSLPDMQIPEFQFLTERDWMRVSQYMDTETNLDEVVRIAREYTKQSCGRAFHEATQRCLVENDQKFPPDIQSLQPYLPRLSDPLVLQNYQITWAQRKTETTPNGGEREVYTPSPAAADGEWIILQKAPRYDSDLQLVVTHSGFRYQDFPSK
jgi:RNA polymerase sigma factor (sigma-70 family)